MLQNFNSLFDLMKAFPDEQTCIDHLKTIRWRKGAFCPYCDHDQIYEFSDKRTFKCAQCRQRFSIKVGTIFADTKLPLQKWFMAIWLITNHPKGIASTTLAKDLDVTQKTAWFVLHRLRYAARTKSFNARFRMRGKVEIDETYIGGEAKNRHGRRSGTGGGAGDKTPVVGAVERDGQVIARVIGAASQFEMQNFVRDVVSPDAEMLVTDAHAAYRSLQGFARHEIVNHQRGEYRRGDAHTNSIESVWALLKRQIIGIHHWVSPKHLNKYVQEMAWRLNRRGLTLSNRMNDLLACAEGGKLSYKDLIA